MGVEKGPYKLAVKKKKRKIFLTSFAEWVLIINLQSI